MLVVVHAKQLVCAEMRRFSTHAGSLVSPRQPRKEKHSLENNQRRRRAGEREATTSVKAARLDGSQWRGRDGECSRRRVEGRRARGEEVITHISFQKVGLQLFLITPQRDDASACTSDSFAPTPPASGLTFLWPSSRTRLSDFPTLEEAEPGDMCDLVPT